MSIITSCPECKKQVRVPESLLGKSVRCPVCKGVFTAESIGSPEESQPSEKPESETASTYAPEPEAPAPRRNRPGPVARDDDDDDDYEPRPRRRRRIRRDFVPHNGTVILVLGILSLVVCGLLGPVAWVMGNRDLKEIRS